METQTFINYSILIRMRVPNSEMEKETNAFKIIHSFFFRRTSLGRHFLQFLLINLNNDADITY